MKNLKGFPSGIGLGFGILAVSTAAIFIRFAQLEAPSLVIAAGRLILATVILAPFALVQKKSEIREISKPIWRLLILAGIFLAFHFASWISSLEYTSVASSVVFVNTTPLWVALLSPLLLKEKPSKPAWIGLSISLIGITIIAVEGLCSFKLGAVSCIPLSSLFEQNAFLGNTLAITGAFCACIYLMVGRSVRNHLSITTYIFIVYGIAAVILTGLVLIYGQKVTGYSVSTYVWIALLAVFPQLIGHSTYNYFLKFLSAIYVSIALLGEPIGAIILAFLILREAPSVFELIGGAIILIGILIATNSRSQTLPQVENERSQ